MAAWAEAFASQLILDDSEWALDELIRIVYNSLEDCLNKEKTGIYQKVNNPALVNNQNGETETLYSRLMRAVSAVFTHAVTLKEKGIRINYLLSGRFLLMIRKQAVILNMDENNLYMQCKKAFNASVDVFMPATGTSRLQLTGLPEESEPAETMPLQENGFYVHLKKEWQNQEGIRFEDTDKIICEDTHHQGMCFIHNNRLYALPVKKDDPYYAVYGGSELYDGNITVSMAEISGSYNPEKNTDIPVLPAADSQAALKTLMPYSCTEGRMTMFPRIKTHV